MGLEREDYAPTREGSARSGQRSRHFNRMMAVVIDQRVTATGGERNIAVALKATTDAAKIRERLDDRRIRGAHFHRHCDRGQCIEYVMRTGKVQHHIQVRQCGALGVAAHHSKPHATTIGLHIDGADLRRL